MSDYMTTGGYVPENGNIWWLQNFILHIVSSPSSYFQGEIMNIMRWEPLREFDELFNRYNFLTTRNMLRSDNEEWTPSADISETDKEYLIKAVLPEVRREDVKVELENGVLTISGERKQEKQAKEWAKSERRDMLAKPTRLLLKELLNQQSED